MATNEACLIALFDHHTAAGQPPARTEWVQVGAGQTALQTTVGAASSSSSWDSGMLTFEAVSTGPFFRLRLRHFALPAPASGANTEKFTVTVQAVETAPLVLAPGNSFDLRAGDRVSVARVIENSGAQDDTVNESKCAREETLAVFATCFRIPKDAGLVTASDGKTDRKANPLPGGKERVSASASAFFEANDFDLSKSRESFATAYAAGAPPVAEGWFLVGASKCIELPSTGAWVPVGRMSLALPDTRLSREHVAVRLVVPSDAEKGSSGLLFAEIHVLGRKGSARIVDADAGGSGTTLAPLKAGESMLLAVGERFSLLAEGDHIFALTRDREAMLSSVALPAHIRAAETRDALISGLVTYRKFNYGNPRKKTWNSFFCARYKTHIALYSGKEISRANLKHTISLNAAVVVKREHGSDLRFKVIQKNSRDQTLAHFFEFQTPEETTKWIEAVSADLLPVGHSATGKLIVNLVSAHGVLGADNFGKSSDPYCVLKIDGYTSWKKRSDTVYKTLNPVWNEKIVLYPGIDDTVRILCWDEDKYTKDDFLGEISFKPRPFVRQGTVKKVFPWLGKKAKGTVTLEITYGEQPQSVYCRTEFIEPERMSDAGASQPPAASDGAPKRPPKPDTNTTPVADSTLSSAGKDDGGVDLALDDDIPVLSAEDQAALAQSSSNAHEHAVLSVEDQMVTDAMQAFAFYDASNTGTLDHKEFAAVLADSGARHGLPAPTDDQVAAMLKNIDANDDGVIDRVEFLAFYQQYMADQLEADSDYSSSDSE